MKLLHFGKDLRTTQIFAGLLVLLTFGSVGASELSIPTQFSSGTRAVASEVNGNFEAVAVSVNDNHAQIIAILARFEALEAENVALATNISELVETNNNLQAEIDSLNETRIEGLNEYLSITSDVRGNPIAVFSGINLHVNNGIGDTDTRNALGNLIIGYDEITGDTTERCSLRDFETQVACEGAGGTWSNSFKTGSHNLVLGYEHNYGNYGGIVAGYRNNITGSNASVIGGQTNLSSGTNTTVLGGNSNHANGMASSIAGGNSNLSLGTSSSISGGRNNVTSGSGSTVGGGSRNEAAGNFSVVSGGAERESTTTDSWAAGSLSESF
jgi:hypothetical protein